MKRLQSYLIRGMLKVRPYLITIAVSLFAVKLLLGVLDAIFSPLLTALAQLVLSKSAQAAHGSFDSPLELTLTLLIVGGLVVTIASSPIGTNLLALLDRLISKVPGVSTLHTAGRQMTELLTMQNGMGAFKRVVLVNALGQVKSLAFVTGETIDKETNVRYLNITIPFPPNPLMGLQGFVKEEDTINCGLTVEQGIQHVISLGMVSFDQLTLSPTSASPATPAPTAKPTSTPAGTPTSEQKV